MVCYTSDYTGYMYTEVYSSLHICRAKLNKFTFDFLRNLIFYYRLADKAISTIELKYCYRRDRRYSLE